MNNTASISSKPKTVKPLLFLCGVGLRKTSNFDYIDKKEVIWRLDGPSIGEKLDAEYIGFHDAQAKTKAAIEDRNNFTLLGADIDKGNVELESLVRLISSCGITDYGIYTTTSHTIEDTKWRVLIFIDRAIDRDQWLRLQRYIAHILNGDTCTCRVQQIMFLPNTLTADALYEGRYVEGVELDPINSPFAARAKLFEEEHAEQTEVSQKALSQYKTERAQKNPNSWAIIKDFNNKNSIRDLLTDEFGYKPVKDRLLSPTSLSGIAGISFLENETLVYSFGSSDPLSDGLCHDAFDILRILKCDGDFDKAYQLAAKASTSLSDNYAYLSEIDKFIEFSTGSQTTPQAFNRMHQPDYPKHNPMKLFFNEQDGARCNDVTWTPRDERIIEEGGRKLVNTYRPSSLEAVEGSVAVWLEHIAYLIPDDKIRNDFIDWMAFTVQHPEQKINWQILLGGIPRIGKDLAIQPLIKSVGAHNTSQPSADLLDSPFNEWIGGVKLVVVQELASFSNKAIENKLKPLCAAPPEHLSINMKGRSVFHIPNVLSMVLMTNNRQPMPIQANNKRFLCIWCDVERKPDNYYTELYGWIQDNSGNALNYLLKRDVSAFNRGSLPPWTPWRDEIAGFSENGLTARISEMIEEREPPFDVDLIHLPSCAGQISTGSPKTLGLRMLEAGCVKRKVRYRPAGSAILRTLSLWSVRNHKAYTKSSTLDQELYEMYAKRCGARKLRLLDGGKD